MTDNETIKALECCIKSESNDECRELGCPFFDEDIDMCGTINSETIIQQNALDLINRQKAEIEMMKDLITYQKQEIKEKEQKYNQVVDDMFGLVETTRNEIAEAKSEARKEFAERLKTETFLAKAKGSVEHVIWLSEIDNLVKEMVGDSDA